MFEVPNPQWRGGIWQFWKLGRKEEPKKPAFCCGAVHFFRSNPFLYTFVELENGNKLIKKISQ